MNALVYLVRKQVKNFFRDLLKHPGRFIAYLAMAALLVATIFLGAEDAKDNQGNFADIRILHGIVLAWLLFLGIATLLSALKSGTTMFRMCDVNFLFVSPIDPKTIMTYGLAKQTATTLFGFIFILFYSGMLNEKFNIGAGSLVALILYSVFMLITIQVLSLLLYNYSNGNSERKTKVRAIIYAYLGLMLLTALYVFQKNGASTEAILDAISSPYLEYFPIFGWTQGAILGIIHGQMTAVLCYTALLAASFVVLILLFRRTNTDYYEDVLQTTETQFVTLQAMKEKNSTMAVTRTNKKIRVGKTGLGRGWGASAFFYKHLCEARRENRFLFLGTSSFVMLIGNVIGAVVFQSTKKDVTPDQLLMGIFLFDIYILYLLSAMGYLTRELARPYIYLVPADPFRKLFWVSMMSILKPVVEGAVFFVITTAVAKANPISGFAAFLAYSSFGMIFVAGNILAERTMGSMSNRGLIAFLFMMLLLVLITPGIVGSIFTYLAIEKTAGATLLLVSALPMIGWNVLVSLLILFLCRNLLSNIEVSN
jgi:hypothetical protein